MVTLMMMRMTMMMIQQAIENQDRLGGFVVKDGSEVL